MSEVAYRKSYNIRLVGTGGFEVSIPRVVIERAARKRGISIEVFVEKFRLVHLFNDFSGIDGAYRFEPVPPEDTEIIEVPVVR